MAQFTDEQLNTLGSVNAGISVLSFIGSLCICLSYLFIMQLRKSSFKLIAFLSLSDVFNGIAAFMGSPEEGTATCSTQSVFVTFFGLASVLWTACISTHVYVAVVRQETDFGRFEKYYHIFVWSTCAFMTILPATTGSYGTSGLWCWISLEPDRALGTAWRFVVFYIPLWATIIYNAVVLTKVLVVVNNVYKAQEIASADAPDGRERELQVVRRLAMYPVILTVVWSFGTINRIQNSLDPDNPSFFLTVLHVVFMSLQGFFNFLAYGMTAAVRRHIRAALCDRNGVSQELSNQWERMDDDDDMDMMEDLAITDSDAATDRY
eukprot:GFYU01000156.1.p1 GENE.GFYU01000156.1~~GFYU01000156.1.p1  ORF type:complete len:321 (-),score=53.01 GFYU01000156.1:123-1085(-)